MREGNDTMKRSAMPKRTKPMGRTGIARISERRAVGLPGLSRTAAEWRARLDELARAVVMIRAGIARMPVNEACTRFGWYGRCEWCMNERWLYWSHIEPKGQYKSQRWANDNAFAFCYHCHIIRWHNDIRAANEFAVARMGAEARAALAMRARACGNRVGDVRLIELDLVQQLRALAPNGVPGIEF